MSPRTFAIWVFGILASMIFGAAIGVRAGEPFWGLIGGACVFACARLWVKE